MDLKVINGNNIDILKTYPDNYFDAVVTDPPYGLGKEPNAEELMKDWIEHGYHEISGKGFMGKEWDAFVPQPIFWKEVYRVLKHGGHVLSFFGTRTYDWGVMSMRFAGFEVRDCIQWLYGSGFPKSHNISKAIDKKPNLELVKDWKRWLEIEINNSSKNQKQINEECGFNAIGYARYDSSDYWATNRPTIEKWEKMKLIIGIDSNEWDFICDSNVEERGYVESTSGLGGGSGNTVGNFSGKELSNNSISPKAKQWDGWGTALKPANEPIVLARKPLEKGLSIAENILKWGVGGINIDASRIGSETRTTPIFSNDAKTDNTTFNLNSNIQHERVETNQGRFPANIILTHHEDCECKGTKKVKPSNGSGKASGTNNKFNKGVFQDENREGKFIEGGFTDADGNETIENWDCHEDCPIRILDEQSGITKSAPQKRTPRGVYQGNSLLESKTMNLAGLKEGGGNFNDKGGASRFFYVAKASKSERNKGLDEFEEKPLAFSNQAKAELKRGNLEFNGNGVTGDGIVGHGNKINMLKNFHPTVKPIKLMQYLVKMITPPNGIVLDPFCGSGTTGVACKLDGFQFVGLEQDPEYAKIAEARIENYIDETKSTNNNQKDQLSLF